MYDCILGLLLSVDQIRILCLEHAKGKVKPARERKKLEKKTPRVFEETVSEVDPPNRIRLAYLSRLSIQQVWVPTEQRIPKHQTAIIFDWDDTLLCSSFLLDMACYGVNDKLKTYLHRIEQVVERIFAISLRLGHTFIVTNGIEGWVEASTERYMPGLTATLQKVHVISARSTQECNCCGDMSQWKVRAFLELRQRLHSDIITNLISIGDSTYEADAANALSEQFPESVLKIVKFHETPTAPELLKELEILVTRLEPIATKACNSMVRLERIR